MAIVTTATLPVTASRDTSGMPNGSITGAKRDLVIQYNNLLKQQAALALAFTGDGVLKATVISAGTTTTFSTTACIITGGSSTTGGVPITCAASANTAFSTPLTISADGWGIIAIDAAHDGTVTSTVVGPGATQAYPHEAAAVKAAPAKTANLVRLGYLTIQTKAGATWVAGTDGLAGVATGNTATTTNYYPIASPWELVADSANAIRLGSVALSATQVGNLAATAISA